MDPSDTDDRDCAHLIQEQKHVSNWTQRQSWLMHQVLPEGSPLLNPLEFDDEAQARVGAGREDFAQYFATVPELAEKEEE